MHAPTVHKHAVQLVHIPDRLVCLLRQKPAVPVVQVQLLRELIPVIDLQGRPS